MPRRRAFLLTALSLRAGQAVATTGWPERPVTLIVPFGAGSSPDVIARLMAERLSASWGQSVVPTNAPGAAATLGVDRVAKAAPDGYTIGLTGDGAMVVRVSMDPPPPYRQADLAPITLLVRTRNLLVVHPSVPAASLPEFVALARSRPGQLSYAHSGAGFSTHLGMEMLKQAAGLDIAAVPYANEGQMSADLATGRVQAAIVSGPAFIGRVRSGELRALAVTSRDRAPSLPEVPTVADQGLPGFEAVAWFGLVAPVQTPPAVVARVHRDAASALEALRPRLEDLGLVVVGLGPEEFAALIPRETARMAEVLRPLGLLRGG